MKRHKCINCNYIYEPVLGTPEQGVDEGTPFEDIPLEWHCPVCYAGKLDFEPVG